MDVLHEPGVREVVIMKSAQVGYTEALNNIVGFFIDQEPAPMMMMQPTLEMGEAWSKDRFAPMVRDTDQLRGKVAEPRSRESSSTLLHKVFPGGHLTIVGANSPASLASRPIRVLLCDEVDRYPPSAGAEGDPIALAKKRTATFRNRVVVMGSTPTVKGASRIEAAFMPSDRRYFFVPCPHCGELQRLEWSQVRWEEGRPETACYVCRHCGALLHESDKLEMLARRQLRATEAFDGIAGIHVSTLYSPWVTWVQMVRSFLEAKKLPETLKTWVNTELGETWEEGGATVEPGSLISRKEPYGPENIPEGVLLLTAGVDTQDDRVEVQLNGWGIDEENWPIEQKVFRGDPGKPALWLEVDDYLLQKFPTEDGRKLFIESVAVDSGGHHTQAVYQFVVSRKRRRVWAIKGMGGPGRLAWPKKASRTAKSRAMVFILGVDAIKGVLYGRLAKAPEPGPGYIHLPASADEEFCKQLTSEKAITKYVRGRPTVVWEPREKGIRQEAQDCWVYAYAAFLGRRGPELLAKLKKRGRAQVPAKKVNEPAEPAREQAQSVVGPQETALAEPKRKPSMQPRRRRGWIRNW
jgi:phage terminase large subunit GpA-like protein